MLTTELEAKTRNSTEVNEGVVARAAIPKYLAMASELRERILQGEFKPEDRLPSFSEMRNRFGATVATVERIYGVLERDGLVERRPGQGTFVTAPQRTRTDTIGYFGTSSPKFQRQNFHGQLMDGIQSAVEENGRHLLFMGNLLRWSRDALNKVDGLLLCNIDNPRQILQDLPPGLPVVSVLKAPSGLTSVVADDFGGAKLAVRHLVELGHRRIACVMEQLPSLPRRRIEGYAEALFEEGIRFDHRWICRTTNVSYEPEETRPTYQEWGRDCMRTWLREDWKSLDCTAVLVQNDLAAAGVMQALQEAGISVPNEVSVMGFDGTEVCDYFLPSLTAVALPIAQIGAKAVEVLIKQIEEGGLSQKEVRTITLPAAIRPGGSTGPVRTG